MQLIDQKREKVGCTKNPLWYREFLSRKHCSENLVKEASSRMSEENPLSNRNYVPLTVIKFGLYV